ncbi:hypothetical protein FB567DRAFT_594140 [Paraphoma chrysanthemicola]|uniref:Uncharacterized protein n=1 Tax=Paraphoma chrysanthemicola TaxID=798071 RepID=A0A8K0VX09_9PLEO|nr:hypothetical protein FB567DRAFT_594140 [Paraphoma chrysanthemicola]
MDQPLLECYFQLAGGCCYTHVARDYRVQQPANTIAAFFTLARYTHYIQHLFNQHQTIYAIIQSTMFGASEDRARQLAYRKRRERIISGQSYTSYRSLSSASRISQQSQQSIVSSAEPSGTMTAHLASRNRCSESLLPTCESSHLGTEPKRGHGPGSRSIVGTQQLDLEHLYQLQVDRLGHVPYYSLICEGRAEKPSYHSRPTFQHEQGLGAI